MKSYSYLRVSGKAQLDGGGFDRQEEVISAYARKADYEIVGIFREEGVSGTVGEEGRPAFQEMVAAILQNGVRVIIVERLDRLARQYRIQETLLVYLASKGITLISAATEEDVTEAINSDPMKRALIQVQGVFAELEKNLLVRKLKAGSDRIRAQGLKCGGRKAYDEKMTEVCSRAGQLRAEGHKYSVVADKLNSEGYASLSGKPFTKRIVLDLLRIPTRRKNAKVQGSRTASA